MSWRDEAHRVIIETLEENKDKTEEEIKKALFDAYPFGMRKYTPYKIWCEEKKRIMRVRELRKKWNKSKDALLAVNELRDLEKTKKRIEVSDEQYSFDFIDGAPGGGCAGA